MYHQSANVYIYINILNIKQQSKINSQSVCGCRALIQVDIHSPIDQKTTWNNEWNSKYIHKQFGIMGDLKASKQRAISFCLRQVSKDVFVVATTFDGNDLVVVFVIFISADEVQKIVF